MITIKERMIHQGIRRPDRLTRRRRPPRPPQRRRRDRHTAIHYHLFGRVRRRCLFAVQRYDEATAFPATTGKLPQAA